MKKALLCVLSAMLLLAAAAPAAAVFELDTVPASERDGCALCGAALPPEGAEVCALCMAGRTAGPAIRAEAAGETLPGEADTRQAAGGGEDAVSCACCGHEGDTYGECGCPCAAVSGGEERTEEARAYAENADGSGTVSSSDAEESGALRGDTPLWGDTPLRDGTDYMELMIAAAVQGDAEAGEQARLDRDAKIAQAGLSEAPVDFGELFLLAKLIEAEAGSSWLPAEWKMAVGEVALNRVASPEFPDTLEEVIYQPGQYYSRGSAYFSALLPSEPCVRAAARLLSGERVLKDASVVFQANFPQGGGVFMELSDSSLGTTYLCVSSHPELYTF